MEWFRLYHEVVDDLKVQRLPDPLFKQWINVLCLASQGKPRGTIPSDVEDLAFRLRVSEEDAAEIVRELKERHLLDPADNGRLQPHNWSQRQRKSDDGAPRVAAHRARQRPDREPKEGQENGAETLHATLQVTPQNRDRAEQKQNRSEQTRASARENGSKTVKNQDVQSVSPNGAVPDAETAPGWKRLETFDEPGWKERARKAGVI